MAIKQAPMWVIRRRQDRQSQPIGVTVTHRHHMPLIERCEACLGMQIAAADRKRNAWPHGHIDGVPDFPFATFQEKVIAQARD